MNWTYFTWLVPRGSSTFAGEIDFLYYLILVITGIAFVIVEAGLLWFAIKYRARPGRKAYYTHGNATAEITWTAVTAVTVVVLGIMSAGLWNHIKGRNSVPADAIAYGVKAKQFEWNVTYAGGDAQLGTPDDFTVRNQLHIPVDKPILVNLEAEDAIHSFFVPGFRVKQDAVPGMKIRVWFQATEAGQHELACAELCGLGHYRMRAIVTVHPQAEYDQWLADQIAQRAQAGQPAATVAQR
ncbi:MAG: cytochrome c oxidase subunit II [Gemmatimonadetes bacterium]|nr:cytochrome c oxidase subunit II [Gemmatimonadota bacterium]